MNLNFCVFWYQSHKVNMEDLYTVSFRRDWTLYTVQCTVYTLVFTLCTTLKELVN